MSGNEPGPTRHARNGDADIAYQDLGGAGGDPLLLVMGLGVSRFWLPGVGHDLPAAVWPRVAGEVRASPTAPRRRSHQRPAPDMLAG